MSKRTKETLTKVGEIFFFFIGIFGIIIIDAVWLGLLGKFGYFGWAIDCYEKTLAISTCSFLECGKVIMSDIFVAASGLIIALFIFIWIPKICMTGYWDMKEQ